VYFGPPIDDPTILDKLPSELAHLLRRANGYVAYHGGLHVRGACHTPEWHSLRHSWEGRGALCRMFSSVRPDDVPFAEDALGHQFLLRDAIVHRLDAETGEMKSLAVDVAAFDAAVRADPVEYLRLQPLERFRAEGGELEPGELLSVYPPYVFNECGESISLRGIPTADRLAFLAELACAIRDVPEGARIAIPPLPRNAVFAAAARRKKPMSLDRHELRIGAQPERSRMALRGSRRAGRRPASRRPR
jgi:hypothetical protein